MSERLEALKRWLSRRGTEQIEISLDPETAGRLKALAQGRTEHEILSFLASQIVEDVLKAGDYESRVNESSNGPTTGDPAPDAEVFRASGEPVSLASKWANSDVALVFLRHYG